MKVFSKKKGYRCMVYVIIKQKNLVIQTENVQFTKSIGIHFSNVCIYI